MIQSNNINVRNLISKETLHKGVLSATKVTTLDVSNIDYLEVFIYATIYNNTTITARRTSSSTGSVDSPDILDDAFNNIATKVMTVKVGKQNKYFIDTKGLNSIQIAFTHSGDSSNFEFLIKKIPFSLPFTKIDNYGLNIINGVVSKKDNARLYTQKFKYAILKAEGYSIEEAPHFFVRLQTPNGEVSPQIRNLDGTLASYGNGQVKLGSLGVKTYYIDLAKYDANYIDLNAASVTGFTGNVIVSELTNNFDTLKDDVVITPKDILFEGKDFVFEKLNDLNDTYNGWFTSTNNYQHLVYLSNDIDDKEQHVFNVISITSAERSNLRYSFIIPFDPLKQNTSRDFRVMIVLQNGLAYVNKAENNDLNSWVKCSAWETSGTNRKIPVKTIAESGGIRRYDPSLPDNYYNYDKTKVDGSITFIEFQDNFNAAFLGGLCRTKKLVMFGSYLTTGERIGVWTTTDGGLNWVLTYDFINMYSNVSASINTEMLPVISEKATVKKITLTNPSDADKDPVSTFNFTTIGDFDINKGTVTTLTLNNHGLANNDLILIDGIINADWGFLNCDSYNSTKITQNIYIIKVVNANTIELKMYRGSYDNLLPCRHVHSVNEHVGGLIVSTGEEHPNAWFLYISQKLKDGSTIVDAFKMTKNDVFRLNSSRLGIQRACGLLMDNAPDPNILFNCDTSHQNLGKYNVDGRLADKLPLMSSNGIWRGKLSEIDDWSKFECILPMPEPGIWMHQIGEIIVAYFQLGSNAVSVDGGKTWEVFKNGRDQINGIYDNRLVIGNGYAFKWK